jgi:hypothetical protein
VQARQHSLKKQLLRALILQHFNPAELIMIETDGLNYICFGTISKMDEDAIGKQIAFGSKTITKAVCNYDINDEELFEIVQALKVWRKYAQGNPDTVKILTDYNNLVLFM